MHIMNNEKRQMMKGIELSNSKRIKMHGEKKKLQQLGNIGSGHYQVR